MAHQLATANGQVSMAYSEAGGVPWHGLGQQLEAGLSIDEWTKAAGMDFEVLAKPVAYHPEENGEHLLFDDHKVLYRSDTLTPLSVVSKKFRVVQPKEVMEFYRELTETMGFTMETAGVLFDGRKYWAMANIGQEAMIMDDSIKGYLMLGTSVDGTMATTCAYVSTRIVCANTLGFAMQEVKEGRSKGVVKVTHRSHFDVDQVKAQLGIASTSWDSFMKSVDVWSHTHVSPDAAKDYLTKFANTRNADGEVITSPRILKNLEELYNGAGKGSNMASAQGTVWGLINAVTEYVDHYRGRSEDTRMDKAYFGDGVAIKERAVELANELV